MMLFIDYGVDWIFVFLKMNPEVFLFLFAYLFLRERARLDCRHALPVLSLIPLHTTFTVD